MDDIYFSDKKNKKSESSEYKRIVTDKLTDSDYEDSADIKSHSNAGVADNKKFKVNIPDCDMDIPEP